MAQRRILKETTNLLALYQYHVGESQIPMDYHMWCCLAGIAACVADRVWYQKFAWAKTTPSLFTFLIGPSAVGKGEAIDVITRYLDDIPRVNQFVGDITPEAMLELMGGAPGKSKKPNVKPIDNSKIFLVTEELAGSIGNGPAAQSFIRKLTQLYKHGSTKFRHKTVAGANAVVQNHTINWLAGTTIEWLVDAVPPNSIKGGFIGRVIPVIQAYDFEKRILEPTRPHDYEEVVEYLHKRFVALTRLEGTFRMTSRAKRIMAAWFYNRPIPTDELMQPTWLRAHDMTIKLSEIFSLSESHDLIIYARHMEMALRALASTLRYAKIVIRASSATADTRSVDVVRDLIRRMGTIRESSLVERTLNEGIGRRTTFDAVQALIEMRKIKKVRYTNRKGKLLDTAFVWQKRTLQ